jgi:hypothetical protein
MKSAILFVLVFFCAFISFGQESLRFVSSKQDLGEMKEGEIKEIVFSYRNVSTAVVILSDVIPQCGCTVASFEKEDLLPEDEASLVLSFDSKNKIGLQRKRVSVMLSNGERYVLVITANVLP